MEVPVQVLLGYLGYHLVVVFFINQVVHQVGHQTCWLIYPFVLLL